MSRIGVYTGTFDPLTFGHLDIVRRAMRMLDRLVIGIPDHSSKAPLFTIEQRVETVRREAAFISRSIEVGHFAGLAVDFARSAGAAVIVRGLRGAADLDYEGQMAAMNATMAPEIETVFLVAAPAFAGISSSLVKEVARGGGAIEHFVPPSVAADIRARMS